MEKKKRPEIVSSLPFSIRCREEIRVKRHWISRWIVRVGIAAPPDQGDDIWRVNACCAQYSFFFFSLSFLKLLVSTRREGWGIYSRRGVFFTLPATSARIDQLFIGRESGSTSLEEKERASWHEWIKGNSSGNYADFSIFFSPPLDLDCPSTGFVASFFSSLPR